MNESEWNMYISEIGRRMQAAHKKKLFACTECNPGEYTVLENLTEVVMCLLQDHDFYVPCPMMWQRRSFVRGNETKEIMEGYYHEKPRATKKTQRRSRCKGTSAPGKEAQ